MNVLMPDEVKEQGVLTRKDIEDTIATLRYGHLQIMLERNRNKVPIAKRRAEIADKFEIQLKRCFK